MKKKKLLVYRYGVEEIPITGGFLKRTLTPSPTDYRKSNIFRQFDGYYRESSFKFLCSRLYPIIGKASLEIGTPSIQSIKVSPGLITQADRITVSFKQLASISVEQGYTPPTRIQLIPQEVRLIARFKRLVSVAVVQEYFPPIVKTTEQTQHINVQFKELVGVKVEQEYVPPNRIIYEQFEDVQPDEAKVKVQFKKLISIEVAKDE